MMMEMRQACPHFIKVMPLTGLIGRSDRGMARSRSTHAIKPWLLLAGFVLFMALPALLAFAEG